MSLMVIVTSDRQAPGAVQLLAAALAVGWDAKIVKIDEDDIVSEINSADKVIFRINTRTYHFYKEIIDQVASQHRQKLRGLLDTFDKAKTYEVLISHSIPTPGTRAIRRGENADHYPNVIKVLHGNQGKGVALLQNEEDFEKFQDEHPDDSQFILQEYINEAGARDKRLLIASGVLVAAMERRSTTADFRANLHLGGVATPYQPTDEEIKLAVDATDCFNLDFAGVDIIDSERGPLVLEVNPSPGLQIAQITNTDVARAIIEEILT